MDIQDGLANVKYFENCMTWNIDGSIGKVFIRVEDLVYRSYSFKNISKIYLKIYQKYF